MLLSSRYTPQVHEPRRACVLQQVVPAVELGPVSGFLKPKIPSDLVRIIGDEYTRFFLIPTLLFLTVQLRDVQFEAAISETEAATAETGIEDRPEVAVRVAEQMP